MASIDPFDWDDLKIFLQAARAGNLSGAARTLRIDHSTVSRRIAHLEAALGLSIFERQPTGLRLSEAGERLLRHVENVESAMIALREDIKDDKRTASGRVRIATMEGIASLYLASRFERLRQTAPGITIELATSPQTVYVHRREADLFLSFFRPPGQGLVSQRIGRFRLRLYGSEAYFAKAGVPKDVDDLDAHLFVSYIADLIQVDCVRWLEEVVRNPSVVFHSSSMIAQRHAAIGGAGLVLLPEFAVEGCDALVPVLSDTIGTTRELWLNVHTDLQYSSRVRVVANFLRTLLQDDPQMQVEAFTPSPAFAAPLQDMRLHYSRG